MTATTPTNLPRTAHDETVRLRHVFIAAFAIGIDRWKNGYQVLASMIFAVVPTWTGLMATVALAPQGEGRMSPLNTATVIITLVGHLILGHHCWKQRRPSGSCGLRRS